MRPATALDPDDRGRHAVTGRVGCAGRVGQAVFLVAMHTPAVRGAVTELSRHLPGATREPDPDGRALVIATARDAAGRPLATAALTGPDPYEMTGSLLAWRASHAAAAGTTLTLGTHGPVTAVGLQTLRDGATQAGLHEVENTAVPKCGTKAAGTTLPKHDPGPAGR
ncbi:hypothetical protein ACFVUN_29530 [Kitasatospora griseola]|uniref:hypothetical protein n=1 Tax=Kitasatospora griseola TaxID=2064 RepID=UPI0036D99185